MPTHTEQGKAAYQFNLLRVQHLTLAVGPVACLGESGVRGNLNLFAQCLNPM